MLVLRNLRMEDKEELESQMIEDEQEESRVEYEAAQQNMSMKTISTADKNNSTT